MIQNHYGFSDEIYSALKKNKITDKILFRLVDYFDPNKTEEPLGIVNLYYYIDKYGDFNAPPKMLKHKIVARAFYESLSKDLNAQQKLQIFEYIEDQQDGFPEEEN